MGAFNGAASGQTNCCSLIRLQVTRFQYAWCWPDRARECRSFRHVDVADAGKLRMARMRADIHAAGPLTVLRLQISALPLVGLYQRMSLVPSLLKSATAAGCHAVLCGPRFDAAGPLVVRDLPHFGIAGRRIVPKNVADTVVIEIAEACGPPGGVMRPEVHAAGPLAVHDLPILGARRSSGCTKDVADAVAVEIADAGRLPGRIVRPEVDAAGPLVVRDLPDTRCCRSSDCTRGCRCCRRG